MTPHGGIHWSELCTDDVDAAKKYYKKVCGWTIQPMEMPDGVYNVCIIGDKPVAGIFDLKWLGDPGIPPHWMTYIAVKDIDKTVKQTEEAGGTVIRAPFDVPGVGRIAILRDPTGAGIGMMTPTA